MNKKKKDFSKEQSGNLSFGYLCQNFHRISLWIKDAIISLKNLVNLTENFRKYNREFGGLQRCNRCIGYQVTMAIMTNLKTNQLEISY